MNGSSLLDGGRGAFRFNDRTWIQFEPTGNGADFWMGVDADETSLTIGNNNGSGQTGLKLDTVLKLNPSALQTLAAGNPIVAGRSKVRVAGSGGAVTLTAAPTIADGTEGQLLLICGTSDTNTLTVQDQGTLPSSNLQLGAATRLLGIGDRLLLEFDATDGVWYEVSFTNN